MKSIAIKLTLILTTIFFTACSNMQVGFEEDSPFYTPPTEKKPEVVTIKKEEAKPQEENIKTESKIKEVVVEKPAQIEQEKTIETVKEEATAIEEESETTFSYSREDGE